MGLGKIKIMLYVCYSLGFKTGALSMVLQELSDILVKQNKIIYVQ